MCLQLEFAMVAMGFHSNQPGQKKKKGHGPGGGKAHSKGKAAKKHSAEEAVLESIAGDGTVSTDTCFVLQE